LTTKQSLPQSTRVIIAFACFAALVGGGMVVGFSLNLGRPSSKVATHGRRDASDNGGFFYKSVGSAASTMATSNDEPRRPPEALYTVELGVFEQKQDAETLVATLQAQGSDAYYTPLNHEGHVIYRVRRGLFQNEAEAQKAAVALRSQGQRDASVVSLQ